MKISICDDESVFRKRLLEYIEPYQKRDSKITAVEFCCGEDLIAEYERGVRFDLIFLDVEMAALSGVDVARKLRTLDNDVMLVFVTSYTKYVPEAFSLNAIQFLEKPVRQEIFNKEFDRAICIFRKKKYKYKITTMDSTEYLEIKDIVYIETYGRHLMAVTSEKTFEYVGNISAEEKKLSAYGFVRCHKGYLLNMYYIYKPEKDMFILSDQTKVQIGRYYKTEAILMFNKYISGFCV